MPGGIMQVLVAGRQKVAVTLNANTTTVDFSPGFTVLDKSAPVPNGRIITDIGVYSATAFTFPVKIALFNSAGNYDIVVSENLVHGGTGIEYKQLSSQFGVPASGSYFIGAYATGVRDIAGGVLRAFLAGDQAVAAGIAGWTEDSSSVFPMSYKYLA